MASEGRWGKRQEEPREPESSGQLLEVMRLMAEERKQDREVKLRRLEAVEQHRQEEELRRREDERKLLEAHEERMARLITMLAQKQEHFEAAQERKRGEHEQKRWYKQMEANRKAWAAGGGTSKQVGLDEHPEVILGWEPSTPKLTEADDVEHYLTTFERVATAYKWLKEVWMVKLAPLLSGKAQAAYASMGIEECSNFEKVREAVFRRYNICEETYRQRFRAT